MAGPGTSPSSWEREFHNVKLSKPASIPFLSDELMDGLPPDCSFKAFKRPQLRRCSFNLETIDWPRSRRIDGGLDGSILKIYFQGSDIPYCLKIFWDPEAGFGGVAQFAVERECINASVLQKMETSVEEAVTGSSPPILINPNPKTKEDAIDNIYGFSREGRQAGLSSLSEVDYEPMSAGQDAFVRVRKNP
ncbi:hypothetical protein F4815DRAFT_503316 [Daldinia loculata]|nr:hypothetical protein F4815DRAFT_503316 [Daldinia loculata]